MGYINADIPDAGRMLFAGSWNAELWPPLKASFDENKGKLKHSRPPLFFVSLSTYAV
jgi:hypothetical protein